jgi:hypothetical protein
MAIILYLIYGIFMIYNRHLFEVCLDKDKKDIMIKALESRLDLLEKSGASRIIIQVER